MEKKVKRYKNHIKKLSTLKNQVKSKKMGFYTELSTLSTEKHRKNGDYYG